MMNDELHELWTRRRDIVNKFIAHPEKYKECEHCRSINLKAAGLCVWCGAYTFLENPERVRLTAREMGMRPYPLSAGVMPRLALHFIAIHMMLDQISKRLVFCESKNQKKTD